jgi:hypothetical protein
MSKLFGTDGVRGVAGTPPLDPVTVTRLGAALVRVLPHRGAGRVLVGRDTRESGDWIEQALARGVASQGAQLVTTGIVPTPAVAYLTGSRDFDAGLVISASHNPFQDNGIKFFSPAGFKLPDELEAEIEHLVLSDSIDMLRPTATEIGKAFRVDDAVGQALHGAPVGLDCANGATPRWRRGASRARASRWCGRRAGWPQHQPGAAPPSGGPLGAGAGEAPLRRGCDGDDPPSDRRRRARRRWRRCAPSVRGHMRAGGRLAQPSSPP